MNLDTANLISKDKIKDVLLNKTAAKLNMSPSEIEKVVNFSFRDAQKAFYQGNSVEISGFGVFKYSLKKLKKDIHTKELKLVYLKKQYEKNPKKIVKDFIEFLEMAIENGKKRIDELENN